MSWRAEPAFSLVIKQHRAESDMRRFRFLQSQDDFNSTYFFLEILKMIMKTKMGGKIGEIKPLLVRSILRNRNKLRVMRVTGNRVPGRMRKWYIPKEREAGQMKREGH